MTTFMGLLNEYATTGLLVLGLVLAVWITARTRMLFPLIAGGWAVAVGTLVLGDPGLDTMAIAILFGMAMVGFLIGALGQALVKNPR